MTGGSASAIPAHTLVPLQNPSNDLITGQYIVIYEPTQARTPAESRNLVERLGGTLLYTYEHALQGFAATLSDEALRTLRMESGIASIEPNQQIALQIPQSPKGNVSLWLPLVWRADDDTVPSPTPSVSPSPTATITTTSTPTETASPTVTMSATPDPTHTTTPTPIPATVTPSATVTTSPTASATVTVTNTATPAPTGTATVVIQADAPWGLDRTDQRFLPLNTTYTYRLNGEGVHAYIVDSGIRATHVEFSGRMGNGFDAVDNDSNPDDCLGHGTHVAGTVGGTTYGVAKAVTIHGVRVLDCIGAGTLAGILAGVDWIAGNYQSPAVVNMSFGGPVNPTIDNAVQSLIDEGLTVIAAAGNSNIDACTRSPAHLPDAITVGSTDMQDVRSVFSNYGTCLDLFAPGSAILSAWHTSDTATNTIDGTSHAAPHVAGLVALYLSVNPNASPAEATTFILSNATPDLVADPQGSPNFLLFSPYGKPP